MPMRKTISLEKRYGYYLEAQERELARIADRAPTNNMGKGRQQALQTIVNDLHLYKSLYEANNPQRIHALLVTTQSHMDALVDGYKTMTPDERNQAEGAYAEYKRQLEQIRNLLTPMKG